MNLAKQLLLSLISFLAISGMVSANTAKPVKSVDIYATPYYSAANGKPEYVNVYSKIDQLLMENNIAAFHKAVQIVEKEPDYVTPMTLLTLSARAYDLGLRDDAVFWYLNGQYRYIMVRDIADLPKVNQAEYAGFVQLVGSFINPYSYCDIEKRKQIRQNAIAWTKAHPYRALLSPKLPSKHTDRLEAIREVEKYLDNMAVEEDSYLKQHEQEFLADRKANQVDERFCWK
ncbi:hypothetical protein [Glaesserella sp.]